MDYISKTELSMILNRELSRITDLNWSVPIQVTNYSDLSILLPGEAGIIMLLDENKENIYTSVSNKMSRRVKELQKELGTKFELVKYITYTLQEERLKRFLEKSDIKSYFNLKEIDADEFINVLPDDHPIILEKYRSLQKTLDKVKK